MTARNPQAGFTLIELLLAMALFSGILLVVTAGFMYTIRFYRNGVALRDAQAGARVALDTISLDARNSTYIAVQTSAQAVGSGQHFDAICLDSGGPGYRYYIDPSNRALYRAEYEPKRLAGSSCDGSARIVPLSVPEKLTPATLSVTELQAVVINPGSQTKSIRIAISVVNNSVSNTSAVSGTSLLGTGATNKTQCAAGVSRSEFCAITRLTSTATLRGGNQ